MSGYVGGGELYASTGEPLRVLWLETQDGRTFLPAYAEEGHGESEPPGVVLRGGASETDFALSEDGHVVAISRNEGGDEEHGFGSLICRAEKGARREWRCAADPKKYDSPLLFPHGGDLYLLGRRNVTDTGAYDLEQNDLTFSERSLRYQLAYWEEPKRCALWRVDDEALTVEYLLDLPSAGDTCFPALVPLDADRYLVYNYTSRVDEPDLSWREGQGMPTSIFGSVLSLPSR